MDHDVESRDRRYVCGIWTAVLVAAILFRVIGLCVVFRLRAKACSSSPGWITRHILNSAAMCLIKCGVFFRTRVIFRDDTLARWRVSTSSLLYRPSAHSSLCLPAAVQSPPETLDAIPGHPPMNGYFRPLRREVGIATLVLAFFLTMCWIRSDRWEESVRIIRGQSYFSLKTFYGRIWFVKARCTITDPTIPRFSGGTWSGIRKSTANSCRATCRRWP